MPRSSTTFAPGHRSTGGCPKGHRRISPETGREWALKYLDAANKVMLSVMNDPNGDPATRLRAAAMVQERAFGRVPMAVEGVAGGPPITVTGTIDAIGTDASAWPDSLKRVLSAMSKPTGTS